MGPSLVLSSTTIMDDWNRAPIQPLNNSSSSNDDGDEDEERQYKEQHRSSSTIASSFVAPSIQAHSSVDNDMFRDRHVAPFGYSRHTYAQSESSMGLEYAVSPLYSTATMGTLADTIVAEETDLGIGMSGAPGEEKRDVDVKDDERKPPALDSPRLGVRTTQSPHRKSHSISNDPFRSVSGSPNMRQNPHSEERATQDRFINPSFSFDDDDVRNLDGQFSLPQEWNTSSGNTSTQVSRAHHQRKASLPQAEISVGFPSFVPPVAVFRLGGGHETVDVDDHFQSNRPATRAATAIHTNLSRIATNQQQPPLPQLFPRRFPTPMELEMAETERGRNAVHTWYERYNELIEYCELYGDCNVPQKYPANPQLGIWVNKQRMERKFLDENKRSSMTANKIDALEAIGFAWAKRKGDASWMYKYHELRLFREQFGTCDVPTKYVPNPSLGRWVSTQRSEYKLFLQNQGRSRHLTQQKIDMLNALGFKWEMIPSRLSNGSSGSSSSSNGGKSRKYQPV